MITKFYFLGYCHLYLNFIYILNLKKIILINMSEYFNFIVCESNTFTSSAEGGLGFTSSIKKTQNFDFTPFPKSNQNFEEYHNEYFFKLETNENIPLQDILPIDKLDLNNNKSNSQKFEEGFITKLSKEKNINKNHFDITFINKKSKYMSSTNKPIIEEKGKFYILFKNRARRRFQ